MDSRGSFIESFKLSFFEKNFPELKFVQDNLSVSRRGVLRGLHFQKPPFEQTKLVSVQYGEVLDVAVDLRKSSPTFGHHKALLLNEYNKLQFLIPKGFAHGFVVLSEYAVFSYKVDNYYAPDHDSGILYSDEDLKIDWNLDCKPIVSKKDLLLDSFKNYKNSLVN